MGPTPPRNSFRKSHVVFIVVLIVISPFLFFPTRTYQFVSFFNQNMSQLRLKFSISSTRKPTVSCRNCLFEMVDGQWTARVTSEHERYEVERFLTRTRGQYFIPTHLARPDGKCGNTTFEFLRGLQHQALWFRPLCDPHGPAPCCYENRCVYKTIEECKCDNCYDMRTPVNAELVDWTPNNPDCMVKQFDSVEACDLLKGGHVYYIGDSFLRQVYIATVNLLTGNYVDSVLKANTPTVWPLEALRRGEARGHTGWRRYCSNWMQLLCYEYINYQVPVCGGTVHVEHVELLTHNQGSALLKRLIQTRNTTRTIFIVGIGIHGTYNERSVWDNFLSPSVRFLHSNAKVNISWPKFIWMSPHAPGILKTPRVPGQSYSSVVRYNTYINEKLNKAAVPILDTFNMTDGVMSYDGAHYGFRINMLKSQIVLNYLNELRTSGGW